MTLDVTLNRQSELFLNGTSAHKRLFSALQVLSKSHYVEKKNKKITGKMKAIKLP